MSQDDTALTVTPTLPRGIIAGTGVALAHDDTPVATIVGNTIVVGNVMLIRMDPKSLSQSDFRALATHLEEFLERVTSVSG